MKRYIKDNKKIFKIINNDKYQIVEIKPIKKKIKKGVFICDVITSYCVKYEKNGIIYLKR